MLSSKPNQNKMELIMNVTELKSRIHVLQNDLLFALDNPSDTKLLRATVDDVYKDKLEAQILRYRMQVKALEGK